MLTKLCQFWWKYTLKLTSAFHTPSLLKARILMLYRKPSAKVAFAKYSFVLPVFAGRQGSRAFRAGGKKGFFACHDYRKTE
jgi:hypothetical protein